jgi:hypothetical protein
LDLTSIKGLHNKLWASKVTRVPISGLATWESWDKMTFLSIGPMARHKKYYKGEGDGVPQIQAMVSFISLCLLAAILCTKKAPTMHEPTGWFMQVYMNN